MAYHDDLIQHAIFLAELGLPDEPKQVELRRAVSAAYYSLFHLLTTEAAQNWKHPSQRDRFARLFDHGRMKSCSSKVASRVILVEPAEVPNAADLKLVAESFVTLRRLGTLPITTTQRSGRERTFTRSLSWQRMRERPGRRFVKTRSPRIICLT